MIPFVDEFKYFKYYRWQNIASQKRDPGKNIAGSMPFVTLLSKLQDTRARTHVSLPRRQ